MKLLLPSRERGLWRNLNLCAASAIAMIAVSPVIGQNQTIVDMPVVGTFPTADADEASVPCSIQNIQGNIASGNLGIYATSGQGVATFFDPAGSGTAGDPGCFVSEPYPFTIDDIQVNPFAAGAFGIPPAEGVGDFEYKVSVWSASDDGEGCNSISEMLWESEVQSFTVTTDVNAYPNTVDVGFDVEGPFFVFMESVSWSGAANRAPSGVLWDNGSVAALEDCRQYFVLFNEDDEIIFLDYNNTTLTTIGWTNVTVNGNTADQEGDIDLAVTGISAPAELTQATSAVITADVSNLGEVDAVAAPVLLFANGNQVGTFSLNLAAGTDGEAVFNWTPPSGGEFELTVSVDVDGDINPDNNSFSITVEVNALDGPCLFEDDIESYELGGLVDQSPQWVLWTPGATDMDVEVTNEQANSGTQSVKIGENPDDVNFLLGNQTAGTWKVAFWTYIPSGSGAYWNIQKSETAGVEWAMQMFLNADGTGSIDAGGAGVATFDFDHDVWNEVEVVINLDANVANAYFAGEWLYQWTYSWSATAQAAGLVQIGAINFYPAAVDNPLMYVDDISFCNHYNNTPCEAFDLVEGQVVVGDNTNATPWDESLAEDAECWLEATNTVDNDVWYTFTVPADGNYLLTTNLEELTNDDTQILVYTSSDNTCEGDLTFVACGEDVSGSNYLTEVVMNDLVAGTVLWIMVDGWNGTAGTFQIGIFGLAPAEFDECEEAADVTPLVGGEVGSIQTSQTFTNVSNSGQGLVPTCFDDEAVTNSVWVSFVGDGGNYFISTTDCGGGIDYVPFGDTQLAIYTGECGSLTEVACNEDIDFDQAIYEAGVEFQTESGVEYFMIIDTWGGGLGEFCVAFENLGDPENTVNASLTNWVMYPNPATSEVRVKAESGMEHVMILNSVGQLVDRVRVNASPEFTFDVSGYAKGLYFVQITIDGTVQTKKLTVQ